MVVRIDGFEEMYHNVIHNQSSACVKRSASFFWSMFPSCSEIRTVLDEVDVVAGRCASLWFGVSFLGGRRIAKIETIALM